MLKENFMDVALEKAKMAANSEEVPVGAVIVHREKIVASAHNEIERAQDATAHAEMIAIRGAMTALGQKFLIDCDIYVTLEPCAMCMQAILLSRIKKLYFGAYNTLFAKSSSFALEIYGGLRWQNCELLLKEFFSRKRKNISYPL
ncbi:tRNA-specific adenosine deaminase [Rickettsiales bacterium]|nr:tRNA-specific adenosine deaminase [Rickettsiales bacterium]